MNILQSGFLRSVSLGDLIFWVLIVGALIVLWIRSGAKITAFVGETSAELKKCSWPWNPAERGAKRYKELLDSTLVVAIFSILLAAFVTSSDFILVQVTGFITRLH